MKKYMHTTASVSLFTFACICNAATVGVGAQAEAYIGNSYFGVMDGDSENNPGGTQAYGYVQDSYSGYTYAEASTSPGSVGAKASSDYGTNAYSFSYWGEQLLFSGEDNIEISLQYDLDGILDGADGVVEFGGLDSGATPENRGVGTAAVRWRAIIGRPLPEMGFSMDGYEISLDNTITMTLGPNEIPGEDLLEDEYGNVILTDSPMETNMYVEIGRSFSWDASDPLPVGFLLEVWALDGAYSNFLNTGELTGIEVPEGTIVTSSTGSDYSSITTYSDVSAVPVPAAFWLFLSGTIGLLRIARRN